MRSSPLLAAGLLACTLLAQAQPADTWSNAPTASDDRYTNPKSKLYAGPNGWHNFGEVRAEVANAAKTAYSFKTGLNHPAGLPVCQQPADTHPDAGLWHRQTGTGHLRGRFPA